MLYRTFASTIKDVITNFKQNQERLEERAKELIRDKRHERSCDKIQTLETQEKESNEAEVKYITEELEGALYNKECLHHRLNTSLDDINKNLNQTDRLNFATNSIKKYFKGIAPLPIFRERAVFLFLTEALLCWPFCSICEHAHSCIL